MEEVKIYTTKEAAKLLHCSEEKIAVFRRKRLLKMTKPGNTWETCEEWVREFLNQHIYEDLGGLK